MVKEVSFKICKKSAPNASKCSYVCAFITQALVNHKYSLQRLTLSCTKINIAFFKTVTFYPPNLFIFLSGKVKSVEKENEKKEEEEATADEICLSARIDQFSRVS